MDVDTERQKDKCLIHGCKNQEEEVAETKTKKDTESVSTLKSPGKQYG